jgi:phosphoribosylanthranilate isomerase
MGGMKMFQIKICGVTRPEDAAALSEAGADAIGLNFFAGSRRFVDDRRAAEILTPLAPSVMKVGVFVNATAEEIRRKVERFNLDWVQLHGDEPAQFLAELQGLPVLRAIRWQAGSPIMPPPEPASLNTAPLPSALLIDAYSSSAYGGTGETVAWDKIPPLRRETGALPLVLAGGLRAENVAEAIRVGRPDAVDTASGVETSPGVKCPQRIAAFVAAAREAFALLSPRSPMNRG